MTELCQVALLHWSCTSVLLRLTLPAPGLIAERIAALASLYALMSLSYAASWWSKSLLSLAALRCDI